MADSSEEQWELCNDYGFVYKRRKRNDSTIIPPTPAVDPAIELRRTRMLKKKTLLKLRDQYATEIKTWEEMSAKMLEMEEKREKVSANRARDLSLPESSPSPLPENVCRPLIDGLLFQVEAQEAVIQDMSNLCDAAEVMCEMQEEDMKQFLIDLPIWASPRTLIASFAELDDDDASNPECQQHAVESV